MALQVKNIIVGAAEMWLGATEGVQPALPAFTNGQSAATAFNGSANWREVGFTTNGLELAYEPTYGDVVVDQLKDSALIFATDQRITVNTTFAETTLPNLAASWGQHDTSVSLGANADTAGNQDVLGMSAGALGDYPVERSLAAVGNAPRTANPNTRRERVYHARRVVSVTASTHALRRTEATAIPVSFRLLADPSYSGSEYGKIIDRTL